MHRLALPDTHAPPRQLRHRPGQQLLQVLLRLGQDLLTGKADTEKQAGEEEEVWRVGGQVNGTEGQME